MPHNALLAGPTRLLLLLTLLTSNALSQGTILWDESINGPISNTSSSPTAFGTLQNGTNSVIGSSEYVTDGMIGGTYGDFFTLIVPNSSQIASLKLLANRPVAVWLGTNNFSNEIGYLITPANGDLMPLFGLSSINSGLYDMYIRNYDFDSGPNIATYRLDFVVQSIPEPATLSLVAIGALFIGWQFRKRAR